MNGEPVSTEHTDVGAYALGLLEAADRQAFEEHLAGCPACAAELTELSGMKGMLSDIGPVDAPPAEPAEADVIDLVRRRATAQRRHTRRQVLLGAAAGVALLAGGAAAGVAAAPQAAVPVVALGTPHSAVSPVTGVKGVVHLLAKPFGTQVTVDLARIQGPLECQFIAVSRTGARFQIGTWFLPPHVRFGSPGHPQHLVLKGWTTIKPGDLSRIDVVAQGHGTQVSIQV